MRIVLFTHRWRLWNAGERAGFPDDAAAQLITQGVAVAVGDSDKKIRSATGAKAAAPAQHPSAEDENKVPRATPADKQSPAGKQKPAPAGVTK